MEKKSNEKVIERIENMKFICHNCSCWCEFSSYSDIAPKFCPSNRKSKWEKAEQPTQSCDGCKYDEDWNTIDICDGCIRGVSGLKDNYEADNN